MDEVASEIIDRETQLADFDHARDDFEQAVSRVPEQALDFKPEGDDYSMRDLVPHVINSITMYSSLLDEIDRLQYQELRLVATGEFGPEAPADRIRSMASSPVRNSEQTGTLDELDVVHDKMAARLREIAQENYARRAPVYYVGSEEAYPTSASDIIGWLIDHYREHVQQIESMLEAYEKSNGSGTQS